MRLTILVITCIGSAELIAPRVGEISLLEISGRLVETEDEKKIVHVVTEIKDIENLLVITLSVLRIKLYNSTVVCSGKGLSCVAKRSPSAVTLRLINCYPRMGEIG
jgi:hypothetical protein